MFSVALRKSLRRKGRIGAFVITFSQIASRKPVYITVGSSEGAGGGLSSVMPRAFSTCRARGEPVLTLRCGRWCPAGR